MEVTFTALKQKDVINLTDGRHMGRVCDITFTFPENRVHGFTVTGCKGFRFSKQEIFIPIKQVVKIGKDAVLVKCEKDGANPPPPPPPSCPPPRPTKPEYAPNGGAYYDDCPPPCPPAPPQKPEPRNRRSYDEYE